MAILSRVGLDDVVDGFCEGLEADADTRLLSATCGGVRVSSSNARKGKLPSDHAPLVVDTTG